ncbi:hypothetical protein COLO4_33412 [Corchorus olitorius]|uniref:Uncharacterized protein n=1 Tax=Corchorus olitorius TaxID=93759 RepID=A0A1R3GTZ4_9ROSI|nr:hypothetical protein COLO4_33412 [Corchorus olitorius]
MRVTRHLTCHIVNSGKLLHELPLKLRTWFKQSLIDSPTQKVAAELSCCQWKISALQQFAISDSFAWIC